MKDFKFSEHIEYPEHGMLISGIKPNVCYDYVSSNYLNGFINYVDILGGAMIHHYMSSSEFEDAKIRVDEYLKSNDCHTNVSSADKFDDILVLGKSDDMYIFFWSDRDCSDCCIGGVPSTDFDTEDEAYESFLQFAKNHSLGRKIVMLPKSFFRGWITL